MSEIVLSAQALHKSYGAVHAVRGISFDVQQGEIFSLLGPNGAGKTTLLSMLSGLLQPSRGDARIAGLALSEAARQVKQVIGVVPQEIALYPTLSARENLIFWGRMYGLRGKHLKRRVEAVLDVADLGSRAGDRIETFSGGMKRRVNVAVALLHEPQLLFLDEPTVGIDPQSRRRLLDTIKTLNGEGLTVLYTTHYMEEAEELSDRIGIIDHGELIALGTLSVLTRKVGHYQTILMDVDATAAKANLPAIIEEMMEVEGVHRASGAGEHIVVQTADAHAVLPALIGLITVYGAQTRRLEIKEPNLEAVFLLLTGRALRD